jgi:capsular polysaccharide transport system permease protein
MNADVFALRRQIEVMNALIYRETLWRFGRRSLGLIEEAGSIVIHVFVFSVMRIIAGIELHDGMETVPFTATGVYTYWLFRTGIATVASSVFLTSRYMSFPIVTPLDVALARGLVNVGVYIGIAFATFWVLEMTGYSKAIANPVGVLLILATSGLFGIGCGLVSAGIFHFVPIMRTVVFIGGLRFLSLVSGTFFVFPDIPFRLRPYAVWIPLLHMNDKMREAYFATYHADWASPRYIAIWVVCSVVAGLIVERGLRRATGAGPV